MKSISEEIVGIARNINEPTVADFEKLFQDKSDEIIRDAIKYAVKQGTLTSESAKKFEDFKTMTLPKTSNDKGTGLTDAQTSALTDMDNGFQKVFKDAKEYKISIVKLSSWIKKLKARLHVVATPEANRVPIPFTLMGNKSATIRMVIKPAIINAIKAGFKNYIEPY